MSKEEEVARWLYEWDMCDWDEDNGKRPEYIFEHYQLGAKEIYQLFTPKSEGGLLGDEEIRGIEGYGDISDSAVRRLRRVAKAQRDLTRAECQAKIQEAVIEERKKIGERLEKYVSDTNGYKMPCISYSVIESLRQGKLPEGD